MATRRHTPVQIVEILQKVQLATARGKNMSQVCEDAGIVQQTYHRWQREYHGLQVDQRSRLEQLEEENAMLRCRMAELSTNQSASASVCPETRTSSPCTSSCVQCSASRSKLLWPETRPR